MAFFLKVFSMFGNFSGTVIGVLYYLLFQVYGLLLARVWLRREKLDIQILGGSVVGNVLHWVPVLFAFVLDFTEYAHVVAAIVTAIVTLALYHRVQPPKPEQERAEWKYAVVPVAVYCVFAWLVYSGFEYRDGVVYSSQATYGDMCMHLGFITSIAQQQTFPPEYSILPGTMLSYPFLCDSISSSIYIWGADLRVAYMLPMFTAGAQTMYGAWLLLKTWLGNKGKALFAWLLYFLNGGLGFVYFLGNESETMGEAFRRLLYGFYQTPTNLTEENIRWSNMIVDMLLPQRATLFGYAILFFALYLLYRAVWQGEKRLFPLVGVLAGALPMFHTHSFLALALVSGAWLVMDLAERCHVAGMNRGLGALLVLLIVFMQAVQLILDVFGVRQTNAVLLVLLLFAGVFGYALVCSVQAYGWKRLVSGWGVYLVITACLALPQLCIWTFGQATGDGFLRGYFNWANIDDNYIWFYVKNLGIAALLFVPGYLLGSERLKKAAFPVLLIWLIAELAVFQPNVYDNNKLLYVAYLLVCGVAAEFAGELYCRLKTPLRYAAAVIVICLATVSAVLTIARECVAEYQLIDAYQMQAGEYIMEHTVPTDKILTGNRHNNVVAAFTGRNIQCGSASYVYYHGLDYSAQEAAIRVMYEEPALYPEIFAEYDIDYIMVSDYELFTYAVDEETIEAMFPCVFQAGNVRLYQVTG